MPVGVLVNCLCVLAGGLLGQILRRCITPRLRASLPVLFGFVAVSMGIMKIGSTNEVLPVTLSVLLGGVIGEVVNIDARFRCAARRIAGLLGSGASEETVEYLVLGIVAFCVSGTGIYGALVEGFSGDSAILLSKAGLDFFTALLFASIAGVSIAALCVPQAIIMLLCFCISGIVFPTLSEATRACFLSVGGVLTMMNGFAVAKLAPIKPANVLPALLLVLFLG